LCSSGKKQTPIALASATAAEYDIGEIKIESQYQAVEVENNGHTVVAFVEDGNVRGGPMFSEEYKLLQFHWHTPSEHTLNGKTYPLELHFVHQRVATGDLAVVGLLFDLGGHNAWLADFFDHLPEEEGHIVNLTSVNPYGVLPEDLSYMHYSGSLTTPPCSEGLKWIVLNEVATLSQTQLDQFKAVFEFNSRPMQPLNGRPVTQDTPEECPEQGEAPRAQINFNFAGMLSRE
jgi:carbonic anhydrase